MVQAACTRHVLFNANRSQQLCLLYRSLAVYPTRTTKDHLPARHDLDEYNNLAYLLQIIKQSSTLGQTFHFHVYKTYVYLK